MVPSFKFRNFNWIYPKKTVILSEAKNLCDYMDFVYICANNAM